MVPLLLLVTIALMPLLIAGIPANTTVSAPAKNPPPPNSNLNATGFYVRYHYDGFTGNSSLIDIVVQQVNASDIGPCGEGDLDVHNFTIYEQGTTVPVVRDELQYNGTMWVAINYSLLPHTPPMIPGKNYVVECYFERGAWNTTTDLSPAFYYRHEIKITKPSLRYPANTSQTIDIIVDHITSTIWGKLTNVTLQQIHIKNRQNATDVTVLTDVLTYNNVTDRWEGFEVNISTLIPNTEYELRVFAVYSEKGPSHDGFGTWSNPFTYLAPYLVISEPEIVYLGRDIQLLNITVDSVSCSVHGPLTNDNVTLANYSICRLSDDACLINGSFNWNATGQYWYRWNLNISYYLEQGTLVIGEDYYVIAVFRHWDANGTSPPSSPFITDRDPPTVTQAYIKPDPPTEVDRVTVFCEADDDARTHIAILSYYNGTHWINVTMLGGPQSQKDYYFACIPPFPERTIIYYRVYVNDTQNLWAVSPTYNYTVADTPPLIAYVVYLPSLPTDVDAVTIRVNVTDGTGVDYVTLHYSFGTGWISVNMTHVAGDLYEATIPSYPAALAAYQFQPVLFQISATDVFGNTRTSPVYAYLVHGTLPAVDPLLSLLLLSTVAMAIIVIIIVLKIYERF